MPRRPVFCHNFLSNKSLSHFAPAEIGYIRLCSVQACFSTIPFRIVSDLEIRISDFWAKPGFGFVFSCPAGWIIAIISFQIRSCAISARHKFARSTEFILSVAEWAQGKLCFFKFVFNPPAQVWGLTTFGFDWLCFFVHRKAGFCHNLLSNKSLRRFARQQIGFVFSSRV